MVSEETIEKTLTEKIHLIKTANGEEKADLVLKNATYINVFTNELLKGDIAISDGVIAGIGKYEGKNEIDVSSFTVVPGLIDSHIHLESSLVNPCEFAKAVVSHGTTTVVCDPHEIANVMGTDGIQYMLEATENLPVDVMIMFPSCVPATPTDESGATLDYASSEKFYRHPRVSGLAEMMNYVGVINGDRDVISKITACQHNKKRIDGHAPELSGKSLNAYIAAGIYSDHECTNIQNALEKLRLGQYIMIREGTAAKNLDALSPLLSEKYFNRCMFATDDKHPNDLLNKGHIDYIIKRAISSGVNPLIAICTATYNAAKYHNLINKGAIAPGYIADIVLVDNVKDFNVKTVIKKGKIVFDGQVKWNFKSTISTELNLKARNTFHLDKTIPKDFYAENLPVIKLFAGEIITGNDGFSDKINISNDILKIAVVERHHATGHIGLGYVSGYGLKSGAVATSIAHDSHNIIAVGTNDEDISFAVNRIRESHGGITVVDNRKVISELPLPIAGLISDKPIEWVNNALEEAKNAAYSLGAFKEIDPFMTLSFMSLSVIPKLKITTFGVFDVEKQQYIK